jgi:predicted short-subunit dehydrogenase-like oxidoreductase (DUF2520 family)
MRRPDLQALVAGSDSILLCVPDEEIAEVAGSIARSAPMRGKVILHTSGASGLAPLGEARRRGAALATLHPLAAFPPVSASWPLPPGIWFGISGSRRGISSARAIARALNGKPLAVPERSRTAYHLAAVMVANHSTVLAAVALEVLGRAGLPHSERDLNRALAALLRTAADRIEGEGPVMGLTGPAARGDLVTLRRHLARLRGERPLLRALYEALTGEAVRRARESGILPEGRAREALRLLRGPRKPSR